MRQFSEVTKPNPELPAGRQQEMADAEFAAIAQSLGLRIWKPGDAIPSRGRRVLIGVATYSPLDMKLLDGIVPLLSEAKDAAPVVELFNVRDVRSMEDFENFVPEIGPVLQTPVAALWEGGRLVQSDTGSRAREAISQWLTVWDRGSPGTYVGHSGIRKEDTARIIGKRQV